MGVRPWSNTVLVMLILHNMVKYHFLVSSMPGICYLILEQSRRDDLEAIGYVLMYFLRGNLPWQGIKAKTREEKLTKIMEIKIENIPDLLCKNYPEEFITYFNSVRELQFEAKPDYAYYRNLMSNCLKRSNLQNDLQFDWLEAKTYLKIDLKSELSQILKKEVDLTKEIDNTKEFQIIMKEEEFVKLKIEPENNKEKENNQIIEENKIIIESIEKEHQEFK